jgi:glucosamine--fructose-6-phosphate aminotransferase (isomerizing)
VNVPESAIARESNIVLLTVAGPVIGVASTKAFTRHLTVLLAAAVAAGRARGTLSNGGKAGLAQAMIELRSRATGGALSVYRRGSPLSGARCSLPWSQRVVSHRTRGRAEAGGDFLYPRGGLRRGRDEARAKSADRRRRSADCRSARMGSQAEAVLAESRSRRGADPLCHPLQLMGCYTAIAKGTDVDQARNLAKRVTVE